LGHLQQPAPTRSLGPLRWGLIAVMAAAVFLAPFDYDRALVFVVTLSPSVFALLHGVPRYGWRGMGAFILLTWVITHFFEWLSIGTGFPFGHYHHTGPGQLFDVPVLIMVAYIGMGYVAWTVALALCNVYGAALRGRALVLVPLVGSLVMLLWDLVLDPLFATVAGAWVWEQGGVYYGVPLTNFAGWLLVVYLYLQAFALYISRCNAAAVISPESAFSRSYWLEAAALYGVQALLLLRLCVLGLGTVHGPLYAAMAVVCLLTMVPATALTAVRILRRPTAAGSTTFTFERYTPRAVAAAAQTTGTAEPAGQPAGSGGN
jgi:uncharacterized membrane protein